MTRTRTKSPGRCPEAGKTATLFWDVLPKSSLALRLDVPSINTSNSLPMSLRLLSRESSFCNAIIRLRRSIFTSSGMLSGISRLASVPGRSEYLNMNAESKPASRISDNVCWKSSSLSLWKPVNMSVDKPASGMMRRIAATRSRYHSRVYLRFIAFSTELLPLCTGRWM